MYDILTDMDELIPLLWISSIAKTSFSCLEVFYIYSEITKLCFQIKFIMKCKL